MRNLTPRLRGMVAAAVMMSIAGGAVAQPGIYAAVDIGPSRFGLKNSDLGSAAGVLLEAADLDVVALDSNLDNKSIGLGLTWGYRFSPVLAAEVAVTTSGKAEWNAEGTVNDGTNDLAGKMELAFRSAGLTAAALGSWPLNDQFSVEGRAGIYYFHTKLAVSYRFGTETADTSSSDRETGLLVGVGGTWNLSRAAALRLSYTLFGSAVGKQDIDRIAVGFQYSLRE